MRLVLRNAPEGFCFSGHCNWISLKISGSTRILNGNVRRNRCSGQTGLWFDSHESHIQGTGINSTYVSISGAVFLIYSKVTTCRKVAKKASFRHAFPNLNCHINANPIFKRRLYCYSIKSCNQLNASLLASFPCKLNTFRKRVKNVVTGKGIQVGIECK